MHLSSRPFTVHKKVPLTISRGTTASSTNLWVQIQTEPADPVMGWGEASPFSIGEMTQTAEAITADLDRLAKALIPYHPLERQAVEAVLDDLQPCSAARAAVDTALWDWLGQQVGLPLWQLWGLDLARIGPTAVTVGINSPAGACDRLRQWCRQLSVRSVKIKLGSPAGIAVDRAMFTALQSQIPSGAKVSIDANGGWSLSDAIAMADWLAERGVIYLEQPLARGEEVSLGKLRSRLPVFLDESCFTSHDIPTLAGYADGVNIKLMKAGGLSEARRMIETARACGLQVMFGCYSDSAIANTALAQLSPLADHLDLDSHLNLKDDPFFGARLQAGCLIPSAKAGLGVTHTASG
ncbi:MAG: dipeptide epimerase [Leptolyngbya sp. SIO4C1]|nr:dipeptide epimerase [Leptolyngbya sp. SIO4C1]